MGWGSFQYYDKLNSLQWGFLYKENKLAIVWLGGWTEVGAQAEL